MAQLDFDKLIKETDDDLHRLHTENNEALGIAEHHRAKAVRLAAEGKDLEGRKRAQATMKSALETVEINTGAIATVEQKRIGIIAQRDKQLDDKARHACGNEIEEWLIESGNLSREVVTVLKKVAAHCKTVCGNVPELQGIENVALALIEQMPEGFSLEQKILGNLAQSIMSGQTPPKLKRRDAPSVNTAPPAPILTTIFAVRSFKYVNPDNKRLIVCRRFQDVSLSPLYAKAALDSGVACRLDDPRTNQRNTIAGHAEPAHAFDLDAAIREMAAGPKLVEPIRRSDPQFVETIGTPRKVSIV